MKRMLFALVAVIGLGGSALAHDTFIATAPLPIGLRTQVVYAPGVVAVPQMVASPVVVAAPVAVPAPVVVRSPIVYPAPVYAPVVVGRPAIVRPRVYYRAEPVPYTVRAVWP